MESILKRASMLAENEMNDDQAENHNEDEADGSLGEVEIAEISEDEADPQETQVDDRAHDEEQQ
jgi:hypothetical protein